MQISKNMTNILTNAWLATWTLGLSLVPFVSSDIFFEPHDTAKWLILHSTTLIASFFLFIRGNIEFPSNRKFWFIILGLFFLTLFQNIRLDIAFSAKSFVDRLIFVLIIINFFNLKKEHLRFLPHLIALITIPITLGCLYWLITKPYPDNYLYAPFFGNINMVAQFSGLAVILLFFSIKNTLKISILFESAITLSLALLYFTFCRSVILGLACALIPIVIFNFRNWRALIRIALVSSAITVFLPPIKGAEPNVFSAQWAISEQSNAAQYRIQLWKSSLDLFSEQQLGIGPGRLPFSIAEYKAKNNLANNEGMVDFFMHNEFLRYLIEDGILFFGLLCLGIYWLLATLPKISTSKSRYLVIALVLFLGIESVFQFPFILAVPFTVAAAIIALALRELPPEKAKYFLLNSNVSMPVTSLLIFLSLAPIAGLSYRYLASEYLAFSKRDHEASIIKACEYNTENWRACLFAGNLLVEKGAFKEGEKYLNRLLVQQPGNFTAYKHLSKSSFRQGDWKSGCRNLQKFDNLLSMKSSLHNWFINYCPPHL